MLNLQGVWLKLETGSQGAGGPAAAVAGRIHQFRGPARGRSSTSARPRACASGSVFVLRAERRSTAPRCSVLVRQIARDPPHRRRDRDRRPAARKLADQEDPPAALQHPAQGRQRPIPGSPCGASTFPRVQSTRILDARRLPVFRPLRLGDDAAQRPRLHPRGDPPADLHAQPRRRRLIARGRYTVCLQYHLGNCKGPVRRSAQVRGGVRRSWSAWSVSVLQTRPAPRAYQYLEGEMAACRPGPEIRSSRSATRQRLDALDNYAGADR